MRLRINRRSLVRVRLSIRDARWRRSRLRPYIVLCASVLVGLAGAAAVATYRDLNGWMRGATVVGLGLLTALVVLLTEPPGRRHGVGRPRRSGRIEPCLPTADAFFSGRSRELDELLRLHDRARAARERPGRAAVVADAVDAGRSTTGPVVIAIHGKPGVGKSALALELGRRLAARYPHGQVYANLGTLRGALAPRDIVGIFLTSLGWPDDETPASTEDRQKLFRSLTTRRDMLFVLDAARDPDQVLKVLPAESRAAVLVTSRRDLGPELGVTSYALDVPSSD
jgi:hypothetical protein